MLRCCLLLASFHFFFSSHHRHITHHVAAQKKKGLYFEECFDEEVGLSFKFFSYLHFEETRHTKVIFVIFIQIKASSCF